MSDKLYEFTFQKIDGGEIKLSDYKGKLIMIVNTASKCGFTKQYAALQELYTKYQDRGLVIIGVPSNNFGSQEPGTDGEIKNFCESNFNITFPMASKVDVKGDNSHPFFIWIRQKLGPLSGPKWNFYKYLISKEGDPIDYFASVTKPDAKKVINTIEQNL
ncbi:MAG UNVERIFIED_CONTAM: glutathione peroxidase [Rickettsiaceae bacterium]|jgi:glutathione peroxidase